MNQSKTITVKNLKKTFGQGLGKLEVLKGIDLHIADGETLALTGKSGSGKSTLLSILAGLDRPDSGEITIGETSLSSLNEKQLTHFRANHFGIVFQQFHLVSTLTAFENVLLPLELQGIVKAKFLANDLLDSVGLSDRRHHLPSQLSGGESQRVAIARALATGPSVIFADEPSGNLDEETGEKVMDLLFNMVLKSKTTLVMVTHDPDLAKRCNRILHLEHGGLV